MGYPYTMTYVVQSGQAILAEHINTSNTEHINNNIPESIDDYSATSAEMKTVADPYSGGSPSLATSLSEELERIRFMIKQLSQQSEWFIDAPVLRAVTLKIEPGATPNTNINISVPTSTRNYNEPTITDATDLAASGSSGSFSLSADGKTITLDITENITGVLATSVQLMKINTATTTEMYFPFTAVSSNNITLTILQQGSAAIVNWLDIIDASDRVDILISFMTAT